MQSIRQGGLFDDEVDVEGLSEYRQSRWDPEFSMELKLDGQDVPFQEYVDLKSMGSTVLHWGQLKLLLGEIHFLTPYLGVKELCVVYVGSAPGHHLRILVDMMPKTWTWELYDNKPCEVFCNDQLSDIILEKVVMSQSKTNIEKETLEAPDDLREYLNKNMFSEAFTQYRKTHYGALSKALQQSKRQDIEERCKKQSELIERLRQINAPRSCIQNHTQILYRLQHTIPIAREHRPNVRLHDTYVNSTVARELHATYVTRVQTDEDPQLLCISDIRIPYTNINEESIQVDMGTQKMLLKEMKPYQASVKFKLPYSDNYDKHQMYLDGTLMCQPFTPRVSHECRLHTRKGSALTSTRPYHKEEFARKLFQFQSELRTSIYRHEDPLPTEEEHPNLVLNGVGTDHCFDCTAARQIIRSYLEAVGDEGLDELKMLDDIVKQLISIQTACKAEGNSRLED